LLCSVYLQWIFFSIQLLEATLWKKVQVIRINLKLKFVTTLIYEETISWYSSFDFEHYCNILQIPKTDYNSYLLDERHENEFRFRNKKTTFFCQSRNIGGGTKQISRNVSEQLKWPKTWNVYLHFTHVVSSAFSFTISKNR
jgi:hypothetical protein